MSSNNSSQFNVLIPHWFLDLLGCELIPEEGQEVIVGNQRFIFRDGILRQQLESSNKQRQTDEAFGYKWHKRDTFESDASLKRMGGWLRERYGNVSEFDWLNNANKPLILDAGCGAAMSALELFKPIINKIKYIGVDISAAIDVASKRFLEKNIDAAFLQANITNLPFPPESIDVIFSEGVLHHTDSTRDAIFSLSPLLKQGGRLMFYVYRKKGPIREFSDDFIREAIQDLPPQEAWESMMSLTKLGKALGELNVQVDVPEDVTLLNIPAGRIDIQRLFYWHVFKAYYHSELNLEEMNHINFDWYAPANAYRQTPEEVREWCKKAGLDIEHEQVEQAGITIIARKTNREVMQ